MRVAIDLECDNLLPYTSKIWCISVYDLDKDTVSTYRECPRNVDEWELVVAHNLLGFDYWALWKIWNVRLPFDRCVDTLVWSRALWPDRPWGHSIADWGARLGIPKGDHNDWTQYSEAMKEYCEQDARICARVYQELCRERDGG